jgi:predicted metalloprotease
MKDNSLAPEYVFLHEMGHVLQVALTGSNQLVPEEFIKFNQSIDKNIELVQGSYEAVEVFADTFAIAIMHDTCISKFDPFDFPEMLKTSFSNFYSQLFEKYH